MKCGQLREYNNRNFFFWNSYRKCGRETSSKPSLKKLVSLPHFVYDISRKTFALLYSINWPNFIAWLFLLLEILVNMRIAIVCYPDWDVMYFEISFIFLINLFFYMIKKLGQKFKYLLKTNRAVKVKWKVFFIFVKGLSDANNCVRA